MPGRDSGPKADRERPWAAPGDDLGWPPAYTVDMAVPWEEWDLAPKTRSCLERAGYRSSSEVLGANARQLLQLDRFGRVALYDLIKAAQGLRLRRSRHPPPRVNIALLDTDLAHLATSARTVLSLRAAGLESIGDLAAATPWEIRALSEVDAWSFYAVVEALAAVGLAFRDRRAREHRLRRERESARRQRATAVVAMHLDGFAPAEIGKHLGLRGKQVRLILKLEGYVVRAGPARSTTSSTRSGS